MPAADPTSELVRRHTLVRTTPLVPELRLHLVTDECALWHSTEAQAKEAGLPEPYWAFCWPGGQALARYVLDHPELARGRRVLDFGSGCAVGALAALRAGACDALAADIDPLAATAAALNAELNGLQGLRTTAEDLVGRAVDADVILAGDVFYDKDLSARGLAWLRDLAARGALVLAGDPSRGFLDTSAMIPLASYRAGADGEIRGDLLKDTAVFRVA